MTFSYGNTLKKVQILISGCVGNFTFTKLSIIEYFKHERDNFVTINDFSKCTNSPMMIPYLDERRHFHTVNILKRV